MKRLSTIEDAKTLKKGHKVTTDFVAGENHIVRTITDTIPSTASACGLMATADDGGGVCLECGRPLGTAINFFVDATWFIRED